MSNTTGDTYGAGAAHSSEESVILAMFLLLSLSFFTFVYVFFSFLAMAFTVYFRFKTFRDLNKTVFSLLRCFDPNIRISVFMDL